MGGVAGLCGGKEYGVLYHSGTSRSTGISGAKTAAVNAAATRLRRVPGEK